MVDFSEFDMTGRVSIVTGAAGLLGKSHCEALLEAGSIVFASDLDVGMFACERYSTMKRQYPNQLFFRALDVTNKKAASYLM